MPKTFDMQEWVRTAHGDDVEGFEESQFSSPTILEYEKVYNLTALESLASLTSLQVLLYLVD